MGLTERPAVPWKGVCLSAGITSPAISEKAEADIQAVAGIIDSVNASRDEKIPFTAQELDIESSPLECVYVSIDDVGVKHQKDFRSHETEKNAKYVENTVVHIQHGEGTYALTACGMKNAMKAMLAFLVFNGLLQNRLVFFTDGARNIKNSIEEISRYIRLKDILRLGTNYEALAGKARYFKQDEKGVAAMCKIMEDMRNEAALENAKETAERMIRDKKPLEKIAHYIPLLSMEDLKEMESSIIKMTKNEKKEKRNIIILLLSNGYLKINNKKRNNETQ